MLFTIRKLFLPLLEGNQIHNPGVGGPQGNPYGTAAGVKPWPYIIRGPQFVVGPMYGVANTSFAPKPIPNQFSRGNLVISPGIKKEETGTDVYF